MWLSSFLWLAGFKNKSYIPRCPNRIYKQTLGYCMKGYIEERAVKTAEYIIETKATVRQTARKFGVSKSTVHKDVTERLDDIDPDLAAEVRSVLDVNKAERHIRGGMATRKKYLHQKD